MKIINQTGRNLGAKVEKRESVVHIEILDMDKIIPIENISLEVRDEEVGDSAGGGC